MGSTGGQLTSVAMARQAGLAVAEGALVAGPLSKRSEWLHSWNLRFAVLTTEALLWQRDLSGSSVERRALLLDSMTRLSVRNESLLLQPPDGSTLHFRAASAAELSTWQQHLSALLATLQASARIVRLWMRDHAAIVERGKLAELPHAGSRNPHARALHKLFYLVSAPADGAPQQHPAEQSAPASPASPPAALWAAGGASLASSESSDEPSHLRLRLLTLMDLPPTAARWSHRERTAFLELLRLIAAADHPHLLPTVGADLLVEHSRALIVRRFASRGSIRDVIAGTQPELQQPYSGRYNLGKSRNATNSTVVLASSLARAERAGTAAAPTQQSQARC